MVFSPFTHCLQPPPPCRTVDKMARTATVFVPILLSTQLNSVLEAFGNAKTIKEVPILAATPALTALLKMGSWLFAEDFRLKVLPTIVKLYASNEFEPSISSTAFQDESHKDVIVHMDDLDCEKLDKVQKWPMKLQMLQ